MARMPYIDPASASEGTRQVLEALPPLNIFRMLAHAEEVFVPFLGFGRSILASTELDPQLRELAILQVAKQSGAEYEWVQHVEIGRHAGLNDDQIAAVAAGDHDAECLSAAARSVLRFTAAVVAGPTVSDEVFGSLAGELKHREIVELLLTIGNYLMLARLMTVLELDTDDAIGNQVVDLSKSDFG